MPRALLHNPRPTRKLSCSSLSESAKFWLNESFGQDSTMLSRRDFGVLNSLDWVTVTVRFLSVLFIYAASASSRFTTNVFDIRRPPGSDSVPNSATLFGRIVPCGKVIGCAGSLILWITTATLTLLGEQAALVVDCSLACSTFFLVCASSTATFAINAACVGIQSWTAERCYSEAMKYHSGKILAASGNLRWSRSKP
uniref:CASP-like protein n=1 Tax=Mycena chlorophos TaxID=658473 RepID=A0ABQ0M614_MYCCL|nr:predicted protein [Mycena chlorophos]